MSWGESGLVDRPDPDVRERRIAATLFVLTCTSVFGVNAWRWSAGAPWTEPAVMFDALLFTCVLMGILLAHELGHWLVAQAHGFSLSMPWFLPAPFLIGTLGAVIRLRDEPRTRTGLLEMGAAGPLAGLAVVVAALVVWLRGEGTVGVDELTLARPAIVHVLSWVVTGASAPEMSARDPVAFAAWLGCLLTAMNLLPFGQLDGGHVMSALLPDHAGRVGWLVTALLLVGAAFWPGWGVWVIVLHLLGAREGLRPRRSDRPLTPRARWVAGAAALAFVLCFTPVPM